MCICKSKLFFILIFSLYIVYPQVSKAQEKQDEKKWNFTLAPFLYLPTITGDVIINNNPGLLTKQKLNPGGMLYFESYSPKWSFGTDFLLMDFDLDITMNLSGREGTLGLKNTIVGFYVMYRVARWVELGLGGRLVAATTNLNVPAGNILSEINGEFKSVIVDPLLVTRFTFLNTKKWHLALRGDVGAFGALGYFTWLVNPYVGFKVSKLFEVNLGYRVLSLYHDDEPNNDRLDLLFYGPQAGLQIHF